VVDRLNAPRLHFDRRAPEELLAALAPAGPFHELVELVSALELRGKALDVQLRANPRQPAEGHATLYIGLTKAIDLRGRGEFFRFDPQRRFGPAAAWQSPPAWTNWLAASELEAVWPEVLAFVRSTIEAAPDRYVRSEGAMQALLSSAAADRFVVVDRESVIGFDHARAKQAFLAPLNELLSVAVGDLESRGHRWAKAGKRFGDELDALVVDADGRVLVMEVKPGIQTAALGWTPAQVALYHSLFSSWARQDPGLAHEVLTGMLAQRVRIGLAPDGHVPPSAPLQFVPVIAVCGRVLNPNVANERMLAVQAALGRAGSELEELEVWQVGDDGTIETRELGDLI
jgi:hypothetical protein